jgi:hypothetical protein
MYLQNRSLEKEKTSSAGVEKLSGHLDEKTDHEDPSTCLQQSLCR